MTVDTTARAEVILEEPEEEVEVFDKEENEEEEEEEEGGHTMNKGKRTTSFEERMLEANPEVRVVVKLYQTGMVPFLGLPAQR